MSLLWGVWEEEGSEQGDMSVKWEMLGAARKVRAALWNPPSLLPGRLVGTRARVKLAVCVPRMMHTVSWALCRVRRVGTEEQAAQSRLVQRWLPVADGSVQNSLLFPEQGWGTGRWCRGCSSLCWVPGLWPGKEASSGSEKLPWAKASVKPEASPSSPVENVQPGNTWSHWLGSEADSNLGFFLEQLSEW